MIKRTLFFIRNMIFLLIKRNKQIYSLIRLFFSLAIYDLKSAASILFFSTESLASVYKYENNGKKTVKLIDTKKSIEKSKKSLFILGSGPTVNEYTQEEWNRIKENDSWGFNMWFCHHFVPSTYITQALREPTEDKENSFAYNINKMLTSMLEDQKELYMDRDFFIRGDSVNKHEFHKTTFGSRIEKIIEKQVAYYGEIPVSSTSSIAPDILFDKLFKFNFFHIENNIQAIPKFGSTITELITFGLMLGYKEIVLCGIDMNDGGHFYDKEEYFQKYPLLRKLSNINHTRTTEGRHEHMDTTIRPFTIKDYIIALRDLAKDKFDAQVYVMSETSALYPEIPKYKL